MLSFPLLALAVASFGIGTTEFVIMGLLPDVARDLDVSIPRAGLLVSGYALGVALGSPLVAIALARLSRKPALISLMAIFVVGNIGCALADSYGLLMLARVVTSLAHGAFFGIGAVVAAGLVAPNKRTQAVAMMFAGLTLANVLGVPFGTALGQALGWRATFWAVSLIGLAAMAAIAWALPSGLPGSRGRLLAEFAALKNWRVVMPMAISALASVSMFTVATYIAPLLGQVTHLAPRQITYVLLLFGVGLTAGNLLGGRLADWRLIPSVVGIFAVLIVVLVLFPFAALLPVPAALAVLAWGALAFALVSPLQIWVVDAATEAPNLASTLNQSAFNLGNSTGAWLGGVAIGAGLAYNDLPWIAAVVASLALALTLAATAHAKRVTA
jgi:DHA1 family inner membrane transport protein